MPLVFISIMTHVPTGKSQGIKVGLIVRGIRISAAAQPSRVLVSC